MVFINKINRVILCIIDDVRAEYFFDLINKGLLPNFKKLMDNGIYSENCITDFPSITYPTQASIITGTHTGDYRKELCHGVPLSVWMGRETAPPFIRFYGSNNMQIYKMNEDLGPNCQTLLEMIGDGNTASIIQFINRGADVLFPENKAKLGFYAMLLKYSRNLMKILMRTNTITIHRLLDYFKKPRKYFNNNETPIGILAWFFSSDILLHRFGYDNRLYKLNLYHIDKLMGDLVDELEKLGFLNETAIAITSDHGNYKGEENGSLKRFFDQNGLSHYHPRKNIKGNMHLSEFGGVGFFNFKKTQNSRYKYAWDHPTIKDLQNFGPKQINLFEKLFKINGCQLMYYRDDDNDYKKGIIHIKRKNRENGKVFSGTIKYQGTSLNYKTKYESENDDADVFGYLNDPIACKMVNSKYFSINEWMEATHHLDYPIYPDLVPRHFKNPRSSDIIVSTGGKVIFNYEHGKQKNKYIYTHDIGLRNSAIVPLIIGGSKDIPSKKIPFCKITDIVATLLRLKGKNPHKSVVGKSLI